MEIDPDVDVVIVELNRRIDITCSSVSTLGQPIWTRTGKDLHHFESCTKESCRAKIIGVA